jgi:hypothetical protein
MQLRDHTDTPKPAHNWRRLAALVAVGAALLGGALPAASATAATGGATAHSARAAAAATVTLHTLHCQTTEDDWGSDDVYIKVNGVKVWTAQDSINDGESLEVNLKVKVGDVITLYDRDDLDPDDYIGGDTVEGTTGTLVFTADDASYWLDYS